MESIKFRLDDNTEEELFVLEQTVIGGMTYLLVSESDDEDEDADVYIFKDVSAPEASEGCYVEVEDEKELDAVFRIFDELLDDVASLEK